MRAPWIVSIALLVPLMSGAASPGRQEAIGLQARAEGIPLQELLVHAQEIVGGAWIVDPKDLKDARIHLVANVEVARDRFLAFFEHCLASQDFVHVELQDDGVTTHRLMKLGQQTRGQHVIKTNARMVSATELAALADRHLIVTTIFEAKVVPARELVTTLNLYFADSATESIRNIEGTDQILATGFCDNLARMAAMIRELEVAAADDSEVRANHEVAVAQRRLEARVAALEEKLAALPKGK